MKRSNSPLPGATMTVWTRRDFLRRAGGAAVAAGLPLLAGCGGGGDEPGGEDPAGGPVGTPVDAQARAAAIVAVQDTFETHVADTGLSRVQVLQRVAEQMRAQPVYSEAGVEEDDLCAWGVFTDGRLHIVAFNRDPAPRELMSRAASVATQAREQLTAIAEVPAANKALLMHSFGPDFEMQTPVNEGTLALQAKGWNVVNPGEGQAHLSRMRAMSGEGFFYINTHGGRGGHVVRNQSGITMYSIQSSTLATADNDADPAIQDDMLNRRLTYFTALNGQESSILKRPLSDTRYGITKNFIQRYWRFADNSVVVINACSMCRDGAEWGGEFIAALHAANAGLVMGWTRSVSGDSANAPAFRSPRYFIDRLTGDSRYLPEPVPQRPFAWDEVMTDMRAKGHHLDTNTQAEFVARPAPTLGRVQALAPSIHSMTVDEWRDELTLHGLFGTVQGKVEINEREVAVKSWSDDEIVCALDRTGPQSSGEVLVWVGSIKSNVRKLTEWNVTFDYRWTDIASPGLAIEGPIRIRWRGDFGRRRAAPGQAPEAVLVHAYATRDSHAQLRAGGSDSSGGCGRAWSGEATFPAIPMAGHATSLIAYLQVNTETRAAAMGLALGAQPSPFREVHCFGQHDVMPVIYDSDGAAMFANPVEGMPEVPLPTIRFTFPLGFTMPAIARNELQMAIASSPTVPTISPVPTDRV